jgi:hypothetical protein
MLFFVLNIFSKEKYNDTILPMLHGQGCGITPNNNDIDYNIKLLGRLQIADSNNMFVYKHIAMQYWYLMAREKDTILKEEYRQKCIVNNIKVLNLHQFKKHTNSSSINNIVLCYAIKNDCENAKYYINQLSKKDKKSLFDSGTLYFMKEKCNFKID